MHHAFQNHGHLIHIKRGGKKHTHTNKTKSSQASKRFVNLFHFMDEYNTHMCYFMYKL